MANILLNIDLRAYESIVHIYQNIHRDSNSDLEFDLAIKVTFTKWLIYHISTLEIDCGQIPKPNIWILVVTYKFYQGCKMADISFNFDFRA